MAQATVTTLVQEPLTSDIEVFYISGDFTDIPNLKAVIDINLRDDQGNVESRRINISDVPGMQGQITALVNAILPRAVSDLETELGATFQ